MQTTSYGGLTAITTNRTTVIVGRTNFDEADFKPLLDQIEGLPSIINARSWDYAETGDLVIWSISHD